MLKTYPHPDGAFSLADDGGWLPGSYESQEACEIAYRIRHLEDWGILQRLQDEASERNPADGLISEKDLLLAEAAHNG